MKLVKQLVLIGALLTGMASASYANEEACHDGPPGNAPNEAHHHEAFFARQQKALHDKLKIQPNQEAAWASFSESLKPPKMQPPSPPKERETAPEQLAHRLDGMKMHQEGLQKQLDALKKFYAVLTPEQKTILDEEGHRFLQGPPHFPPMRMPPPPPPMD